MNRLAFLLAITFATSASAQDYSIFTHTLSSLYKTDSSASIDSVWQAILEKGVPFVHEDSVAFLYRGGASSVSWIGDFNNWGFRAVDVRPGVQIPGTDIWISKISLPKDARLDYKLLIDGTNWILDPHNNFHQWSGVGGGSPNSELRMPEWKEDPLTLTLIPGAQAGIVEHDVLFHSKALGYQVMYSVYTPRGYTSQSTYPVMYVTDGYEYMHERLGNMITVLDNLIHLGKIKPIVVVFIDNREPINRSNNRRMMELAMNEKYLHFLTDEFVTHIEAHYRISKDPADRGILGTSVGGLSAAYFAFSRPDIFGLAGIQSPAFWFRSEIFALCDNPDNPPVKTFMTTGAINDTNREGALKMKAILDKNTCTYQYREVNQGHSWGNWRDLIDDILIYFFAPESSGSRP